MIVVNDIPSFASAMKRLNYIRVCFIPEEYRYLLTPLENKGLIKPGSSNNACIEPTEKVKRMHIKELKKTLKSIPVPP